VRRRRVWGHGLVRRAAYQQPDWMRRHEAASRSWVNAAGKYSMSERAAFANYGYFSMLVRSGLDLTEVELDLAKAEVGAATILADFGIFGPDRLLFRHCSKPPRT
jgi:hypothetical protein